MTLYELYKGIRKVKVWGCTYNPGLFCISAGCGKAGDTIYLNRVEVADMTKAMQGWLNQTVNLEQTR